MVFESAIAYDTLHPYFQQRIYLHEPLSQHSSFGVGGPADLWLLVETRQELSNLVGLCARQQWPLLVVGTGSNILYADAGVRGIVASMALSHYQIEKQSDTAALVIAEAGVRWSRLLEDLVPLGWGGLEFAVSIPGTLGAGIISNVGAHNWDVGQVLEWIEVLDARECNRMTEEPAGFPVLVFNRYPHDSLDLGYRHSRFREQRLTHIDPAGHLILPPRGLIEPAEVVVALALRVQKQDTTRLAALLEHRRQERKQDDPAQRRCGSIFKDPPGTTARALIEEAGLSASTSGDARISEYNANYIVNQGVAGAADIANLIVKAHQQVLAQSGIHLALNVELLGEWQPYADALTVS
jgi:UDP-N-acetylmuramate dehydrogenase